MSQPECLIITNNCREKIKVFLRYTRPKKRSVKRPSSYTLRPGESLFPIVRHLLEGAKNWDLIKNKDCVAIESVPFEPRFVEILNKSDEQLELVVRPSPKPAREKKRKAALKVKPGEKSRPVEVRSITQRQRLSKLVKKGEAEVIPVYEIGPSTGRGGAVASYAYDDVYTCYKCGGPIIFRGDPPTPVHI